jgi:pyruvate,water dikinase
MIKKEVDRDSFVRWFSELSHESISVAGGKGASLAEMYNNKFPIPPGFVITAQAYKHFLEHSGIKDEIHRILRDTNVENTEELNEASVRIRKTIETAEFSKELEEEIIEAYGIFDSDNKSLQGASKSVMDLMKTAHELPFVAVRSSATAEDLVDASFAGQQDSFLNVKGNRDLLNKVRKCFSSLFTPRAIYYRTKKKFEHEKTYLAVVIQRMIDSDKSGVMFSKNPIKKDDTIMIEAVWGLGEGIVSGQIKPDSYIVDRNLDKFDIKKISVSEKKIAFTRNSSGNNEIVKLNSERSKQQVLNNYEIKRLSQYAMQLEQHYGIPQDIEFAIENEKLYIVQSRPITTKAVNEEKEIEGKQLLSGMGASPGVGSGVVRIIKSIQELVKIRAGDILVTEMTNPDMVVSMQKAAGIITDEGGATSHAAIVSREMGIPAVVGTGNATSILKDGDIVTVDGNNGKVYEGKAENKKVEIKEILPTKTKIKVIVDLPDFAERAALTKSKSVGLTRLEGIIAMSGKHPLAFIKENNIRGYIEVLFNGLKKIVKPFEEVWVRSSDIRSDEYRNIEGAPKEIEGNPMLGDHGIRFSLRHQEILRAELQAIKEIADEFPNKKIGLMMPQVISLSDLTETKRIAREEVGIPKNVKIGIMVETPAAVMIIEDFCKEGLDFVSFGTNDLTQYVLAIDRNNEAVQYLYSEMHPAVLKSLLSVIQTCKKYNVETSICGQAGSKPEMAAILVKAGISSLSVNADAAFKVSQIVSEIENSLDEENVSFNKSEEKEELVNQAYSEENKDIEELVLQELSNDEYNPGFKLNEKADIPPLNDSMSIESSDLFQQKNSEIKSIELQTKKEDDVEIYEENTNNLGNEWDKGKDILTNEF